MATRISGTGTGIGRALRTARERRGKSLAEASRETRLKAEYLNALEHEDFEALRGDVYVRGFLRTYARYLGLDPSKVIGFYERAYGKARPAPAPVQRAPGVAVESVVDPPERHRRTAWLLASFAAGIVLISAGAIGLLSRDAVSPPPAPANAAAPGGALPAKVQVDMIVEEPVGVTVTVDDQVRLNGPLEVGEAHSFAGEREVRVHFDDGDRVRLIVDGEDLGRPGRPGVAYDRAFVTGGGGEGSAP